MIGLFYSVFLYAGSVSLTQIIISYIFINKIINDCEFQFIIVFNNIMIFYFSKKRVEKLGRIQVPWTPRALQVCCYSMHDFQISHFNVSCTVLYLIKLFKSMLELIVG